MNSLSANACGGSIHTDSEGPESGFKYVDRRSNRKTTKNRKGRKNLSDLENLDSKHLFAQTLHEVLDSRRLILRKFDWIALCNDWLGKFFKTTRVPRSVRRVVCLALGSFSPPLPQDLQNSNHQKSSALPNFHATKQSQYQLVFLLDVIIPALQATIAEFSHSPPEVSANSGPSSSNSLTVTFYDPVFCEEDKNFIRSVGYTVLEEEPDIRCENPTFFYMPHAPKSLYEKLIAENWKEETDHNLDELIILGNDLGAYLEALSLNNQGSTPLRCLENRLIERQYPPSLTKLDKATGVHFFSETCLQWFPGT